MNASKMGPRPAWVAGKQARSKRRQHGFALYEGARRTGWTAPVAQAHARFEHEARQALREWLML